MALSKFIRLRCLHFCLLLLPCVTNAGESMRLELEKSVCGMQEPFVFWLWSSMAGRPDSTPIGGLSNVEDISIQTVDGAWKPLAHSCCDEWQLAKSAWITRHVINNPGNKR
jgi:hypothetical protein